jgi:RTX calcium-binding nonapeptide repeat (4 copies)
MLGRRPRSFAFSIALVAAVCFGAAPAYAGITRVSWPVFISVKAAPNTNNDVRMYYKEFGDPHGASAWENVVYDDAGVTTHVTDPPTCYPISRASPGHPWTGKAVTCPDGTSQEREGGGSDPGAGEDFRVLLGDRADRFNALDSLGAFDVRGGSGSDKLLGNNAPVVMFDFDINRTCGYFTQDDLYGERGNDSLYGRLGDDLLSGGSGKDYLRGGKDQPAHAPGGEYCAGFGSVVGDTLLGGSGNDKIWAADGDRDLRIDCGPGRDKATLDRKDPKPKHCEKVKRLRN